jgi:hypothetical protein
LAPGCEFCYLVAQSSLKDKFLPLTDGGKFQIELTCTYPPDVNVTCPKVLKDIKKELVHRSEHQESIPRISIW